MPPPQQAFCSANNLALCIHKRLIVHLEFAARQSFTQLCFGRLARQEPSLDFRIIDDRGASAAILRLVKSNIGELDQVVYAAFWVACRRDSDAVFYVFFFVLV